MPLHALCVVRLMPASPHRANHGGLLPLFAVIGGAEARLDDAVRLARPAAMAGTEMPLTIATGMQHIFSICF